MRGPSGISVHKTHPEEHAHDGADGSGTVAHADTTGKTANDHHDQAHVADSSGPHTGSGLTIGHVLRASSATAFAFAQLQHADLGGVSADQHHAQDHPHDGLITQKLLAANTHETPSPDTHHDKSHEHDGLDGSGTVAHADTTGKTADDHHDQDHQLRHQSGGADELSHDLLAAFEASEHIADTGNVLAGAAVELTSLVGHPSANEQIVASGSLTVGENVIIGDGARQEKPGGTAIATMQQNVIIGRNARITAANNSDSAYSRSVAIGHDAGQDFGTNTFRSDWVAIGNAARGARDSVAVGSGAGGSVGVGDGVALGRLADWGATQGTAVGSGATAAIRATALGMGAQATHDGSVAIGRDNSSISAASAATNDFILGTTNHNVKVPGTLNLSKHANFADLAAAPTTAGQLQRNGTVLQFHDGTAARTLAVLEIAQTWNALQTFDANVRIDDQLGIGAASDNDILKVVGTPGIARAHITFGLASATSGSPSAKMTFAGAGIQHAGLFWTPASPGFLTLAFGGSTDPASNTARIRFYNSGNLEFQQASSILTTAGDLTLSPAGNVKFGTHTAIGTETVTGYITIKDAGGATRKLAVVS